MMWIYTYMLFTKGLPHMNSIEFYEMLSTIIVSFLMSIMNGAHFIVFHAT